MRIVDYDGNEDIEDIETLSITIKAVPFENGYVPAFIITSPDDEYEISINEMNALMDGIEIATKKVDDIIEFILREKVYKAVSDLADDDEEDEEDVDGESN